MVKCRDIKLREGEKIYVLFVTCKRARDKLRKIQFYYLFFSTKTKQCILLGSWLTAEKLRVWLFQSKITKKPKMVDKNANLSFLPRATMDNTTSLTTLCGQYWTVNSTKHCYLYKVVPSDHIPPRSVPNKIKDVYPNGNTTNEWLVWLRSKSASYHFSESAF